MEPYLKKFIAAIALCTIGSSALAWTYTVKEDKMTGKKTSVANVQSNGSLSLPFPYQGRNMGYLVVRQHPQHGLDVMVQVDKGQMLCSTYSGCDVLIRFDDKKPARFSGTEPADNSSDTIFLNNTKRFIDEAKKAKKILVQVQFYQAGNQVLEFDVASPLVWPPK